MSDSFPAKPHRFLYFGLPGSFLLSIIVRAALTLNREVDIDEFEHLHAGWMMSHHYLIYRDFWENHTPLFYYLLLPLFRLCREGPGLVVAARIIMSLAALGILLLTYALSRIDHDKLTSFLAVLILSYMVLFVEKSIEVRPDQFVVILWLASLWICIRANSASRLLWFLLAGLLLGIAFLFSPKALLPFAAMSFTFLVQSYRQDSQRRLNGFLKLEGSYILGFLIPVTVCAAFFYHVGILQAMISATVLENFRYPNIYRPTYLLHLRNIGFFLLAFAGLIMQARQLGKGPTAKRADQVVLLIPTLFLLAVFIFVQTAPYPQSTLVFAPMLAIYGAQAFKQSCDRFLVTFRRREPMKVDALRRRVGSVLAFVAVLAAAFVIPCWMVMIKDRPFSRTNSEQFQRMEYVLNHTQSTDAIFDGKAAYVFRPQAYFYGSLFNAIIWRIQRGEIKQDIPESLSRTRCRWVIYDERVAALPKPVQLFLSTNYEPSEFPGVYRVKKHLN